LLVCRRQPVLANNCDQYGAGGKSLVNDITEGNAGLEAANVHEYRLSDEPLNEAVMQ